MPEQKFDDPEKQKLWDHYVTTQQEQDPTWKKFARKVIDTISGAAEGLVGVEPNAERKDISDWSNLATQGITSLAGLPFAAFKNRIPKLFHGTQKNFERFDPSVYDKNDVLGWMTHASENPEYAGKSYAMGHVKGPLPIKSFDDELPIENTLKDYYGKIVSPRIIPIHPEAKNVLDLVDPNIDDLSQAVASMGPSKRKQMIENFKDYRRNPDRYEIDFRHSASVKDINTSPATRLLSENLRLRPSEFERSPFDAIRYLDMYEKSWAFPSKTPLKVAYGKQGEVLGPELHPEITESKIKGFKVPEDFPRDESLFPIKAKFKPEEYSEGKEKLFSSTSKSNLSKSEGFDSGSYNYYLSPMTGTYGSIEDFAAKNGFSKVEAIDYLDHKNYNLFEKKPLGMTDSSKEYPFSNEKVPYKSIKDIPNEELKTPEEWEEHVKTESLYLSDYSVIDHTGKAKSLEDVAEGIGLGHFGKDDLIKYLKTWMPEWKVVPAESWKKGKLSDKAIGLKPKTVGEKLKEKAYEIHKPVHPDKVDLSTVKIKMPSGGIMNLKKVEKMLDSFGFSSNDIYSNIYSGGFWKDYKIVQSMPKQSYKK